MIYGNSVGGVGRERTYILVDEEGNEVPAVVVSQEVVFDAVENDIRIGKVAATANGVTTGTKEIPAYYVAEGYRIVPNGSLFTIPHGDYDYKKLQAIICAYNTSLADSVAAVKIAILDNVYDVNSTVSLSVITKDDANSRVNLGITNETGGMCIVRYIMYKEIY